MCGISRLRVLDLVGGDQPLGTEDGAVQVALNGEIYNFAALRERLRAHGHRFTTAVDRLVRAHLARQADHGRVLWALVVFEAWRQR